MTEYEIRVYQGDFYKGASIKGKIRYRFYNFDSALEMFNSGMEDW